MKNMIGVIGVAVGTVGALHYVWANNRLANDESRINALENKAHEIDKLFEDNERFKQGTLEKFSELEGRLSADEAVNNAQTQKISGLEDEVIGLQEVLASLVTDVENLKAIQAP